ncbi:acriflavin resistance protein [Tistrella bauzanensis]|uniref:Acriflavin resistance protein n=1 Tax=Tistrella bauzanensis TaxID=657419 RepID=A0ABQ1IDF9_9PROT|nr:efflux RND transporter permease subunit [Tistrella bauzanensis]GGB36047.1 acriflavin resistance protein [Tistrella bauzanensis]
MLISDLCIQRPVFAIVINLILALLGIYALDHLSIRQLPAMDFPYVTITTVYPGAAAEQVERQLTTPIEQAVSGVPGVQQITSQSRAGMSLVQIQFRLGLDGLLLANEVRNKVAPLTDSLPPAARAPVVAQQSLDAQPIMFVTVASQTHDALEISDTANRLLLPRISALEGVAQALLLGERRYAIRLVLDPIRLASYGLTIGDVRAAVVAQNADVPGGEIRTRTDRTDVVVEGALATAAEFERLVVRPEPGYLVRVSDIGRVEVGPESLDNAIRFDGQDVVAIGIVPQSTANPLDIAKLVKAELPALEAGLPGGFHLTIAFDSTVYIEASVHEVFETIIIAVGLVLGVVVLFLGSLRSSAIALVTIPLSLLGTLGMMAALDFSINTLTLMAVVLAIGLVVDDAIVEIENVQRHVDDGLDPFTASFLGSREIGFAVIATTLTLAAVFAPIGLVGGQIGMLFREFAFTLAGAVLVSGFIARTLSPMMCARLIGTRSERGYARRVERLSERVAVAYGRLLGWLLHHRWIIVLAVVGALVFGYGQAGRLGFAFAPTEDQGYILFDIEARGTSTLSHLEDQVAGLETILRGVPEATGALTLLGSPSPSKANAYLLLKPWDQRQRSALEIGDALKPQLAALPGLRVNVLQVSPLGGGGSSRPIQLMITTTGDYQDLAAAMDRLVERARAVPSIADPASSLQLERPELRVTLDRDGAGEQGVTATALGDTLQAALGGNPVSTFSNRGELYKVIIDLPPEWRGSIDTINTLEVRGKSADPLPLRDFVQVTRGVGADMLEHTDGLRSATFTAGVAPGHTAAEAFAALLPLTTQALDPGMKPVLGGDAAKAGAESGSAGTVLLLALVFIYFMLSAQFESFRDPAIVLAVAPLAVAGAIVTLAETGGGLNIYSFIGFVTLIGLIAKHGILITEFANQLRDAGRDRTEAVVEAATTRLRPIIMTTIATVLGAVPLAIATGAGAGGRTQLGWVIVGGMTFGTIVSLFVIPAVYTLLSRKVRRPLVEPPPPDALLHQRLKDAPQP